MLLVLAAFVTFQWQWMVVAVLALLMSIGNLYGYVRCKWSKTDEMTKKVTSWMSLLYRV